MGIALAYVAAAAPDAAAASAGRRPGGPLGRPHVTGRRRDGLFRKAAVVVELGPAGPGSPARRHHLYRCYEG